jgi:hypothetical protein
MALDPVKFHNGRLEESSKLPIKREEGVSRKQPRGGEGEEKPRLEPRSQAKIAKG